MGRGRAKAKQTKVARELKYFSPDTDLSKLERELHGSTSTPSTRAPAPVDDAGDADDDSVDGYDGYDSWAAGGR